MEIEKDDIRSDLEAAFEEHETDPETGGQATDPEEPVRAASEETTTEPATSAEGDAGKLGETEEPSAVTKPVGAKPDATAAVVAETPAVEQAKAPPSWRAVAKAEWAKVPLTVQAEITRREAETTKALNTSVNARKHWDEFNTTVAPFMPLIRAQNSTPMGAFKNLMTTAAGLTVGNAEQKARIVAEMVQNFGIDLSILDTVLSQAIQQNPRGQAPGTNPMEVSIQRQLAPIYEVLNGIQQSKQQRDEQVKQEADVSVQQFAEKNEFFDDVRDDVADLLEINANRGRTMSLDQAYKIAIAQHPEISQVVAQRQNAARAQQRGKSVAAARNAASSVRGAPTSNPSKNNEPQSRREELSAAWDDLQQN